MARASCDEAGRCDARPLAAAYDGPWYRDRSPLEVVDAIDVPVLMTGGLNDLLQRGEPLLYERMKDNTLVKWAHGPWGHASPSRGSTAGSAGVANGAECFPDVTMQVLHDAERPSSVALPLVGAAQGEGGLAADPPEAPGEPARLGRRGQRSRMSRIR